MQPRLPDINSSFITWRGKVTTYLDQKKYTDVAGALISKNGLLPSEYRIKISTQLYEEKIKEEVKASCKICGEEFNYHELPIRDKILTYTEQILLGDVNLKVWNCPDPNCKGLNYLDQTDITKTELGNPYYIGVVPEFPEKTSSFIDLNEYHKKVKSWTWQFLAELEHAESRFREEYTPEDYYDIFDDGGKDTGEEA